jgi:hypothetical protein
MAKTPAERHTAKPRSNAERQAAFRRRHLDDPYAADDAMLARLNLLISVSAKWQLERLAACYGVTKRSILEHALNDADHIVFAALTSDPTSLRPSVRRKRYVTARPEPSSPEQKTTKAVHRQKGGPFCAPIRGPDWTPLDSGGSRSRRARPPE